MLCKRCCSCKELKPADDFYSSRDLPDGLSRQCKPCKNHTNKKYFEKNRSKVTKYRRDWELKSKYNISLDTYEDLLRTQANCCKICKTPTAGGSGGFHVDHDHKTGIVRGLLCMNCNRALGHVQDDISILNNMISYLENKYE